MADKLRVGIVAICDNVYKDEATNKAVLAGLYSGAILLEQVPVDLRFAIYAEIFLPDEQEHELDLQFFDSKKLKGGARVSALAKNREEAVALILPQISVPLERPTIFELRCSLDGGKAIKLIRKEIRMRDADMNT